MTDEETGRTYDRACDLQAQLRIMAQEMFGHLAALGMPPIGVLLMPDGSDAPIDILRARAAAERDLVELTDELRVRERQMAHVSAQKTPIELESLTDMEAGCCAQMVSGAFVLQKRAPGRLIVIDPENGALFFAGAPKC